MLVMNASTASSRFLLLPELERTVSAQQPVLRRYSLARLPQLRDDARPEGRGVERGRE
jgi:hypothetical protein